MGTKIVRTLRNLAVLVILGAGVGLFAMQTRAGGIGIGCHICPCGGYRVCGATPCPDCPVQ